VKRQQTRIPRFHVETALNAGTVITLDKEASRHLAAVLRAKTGMAVCLFNGDGHDYAASIESVGKATRLAIGSRQPNNSESPVSITLVQGISRGDRMDATVRQATELGATRIVPIETRHTSARLEGSRREQRFAHWRAILVSACEQCGRSTLPILEPITSLPDWLEAFPDSGSQGFVLLPDAADALATTPGEGKSFAVLIGPESGLDDAEAEQAVAAGFRPAHLGPRVLRTETAGPAAISILQACHGDF